MLEHQTRSRGCLRYLMDVFTGADGGLEYLNLRILINGLAEKADAGDEPAEKILELMYRFERLVHAAQKGT